MGASVWSFDARRGADGSPVGFRGEKEVVSYSIADCELSVELWPPGGGAAQWASGARRKW